MKAKGRRVARIFLGLVCMFMASLALVTWRAIRQERLDTDLITAEKLSRAKSVASLLQAGADANAFDRLEQPEGLWAMVLRLLRGSTPMQQARSALAIALEVGPDADILNTLFRRAGEPQ